MKDVRWLVGVEYDSAGDCNLIPGDFTVAAVFIDLAFLLCLKQTCSSEIILTYLELQNNFEFLERKGLEMVGEADTFNCLFSVIHISK